jgi:hypothetical protein
MTIKVYSIYVAVTGKARQKNDAREIAKAALKAMGVIDPKVGGTATDAQGGFKD